MQELSLILSINCLDLELGTCKIAGKRYVILLVYYVFSFNVCIGLRFYDLGFKY